MQSCATSPASHCGGVFGESQLSYSNTDKHVAVISRNLMENQAGIMTSMSEVSLAPF